MLIDDADKIIHFDSIHVNSFLWV